MKKFRALNNLGEASFTDLMLYKCASRIRRLESKFVVKNAISLKKIALFLREIAFLATKLDYKFLIREAHL